MPTLGQRIRARMALTGMGRADLERETGISPATLSRMMRDHGSPRLEHIATVARVLGTTIDELVGRTDHITDTEA